MKGFPEVGQAFAGVFQNFHWMYVIEGVLFYLLIYFVSKILWENNAKRLVAPYLIFNLIVGVVCVFANNLDTTSYALFLFLSSLFFLLVFSMEIKRSVWNARRAVVASKEAVPKAKVGIRAEDYISSLVKAVQNLSKANIGALIVLSNGNLPKDIIESGVALDAHISSQLIEGIFIPKAPLHDGAMIIYADKIQAAGCFLPLTQKDYPKDFGTRHRAGIGVTEVADVMTMIVSEETGIVSVVKRGIITRYVDSDGLKKFLREYYWKEFNVEGRKA